jgi:hypothetical protein
MRLFNLRDDPEEKIPMDKDLPQYQELFNLLKIHIIRAGAVPWQNPV